MARPSRRVLAVGAEPEPRETLRRLLASEGLDVEAVSTGPAGVLHLGRERPDALFLDLALPCADLLLVLGRVRQLDPPPPVIGLSHRDGARPVAHPDIQGYAIIPFHRGALRAVVRRVLGLTVRPPTGHPSLRAHRRCQVVLDMAVFSREGQCIGQGKIADLSVCGAQPHLDTRIEVGTRVFVGFRLPGYGAPVTVPAQVRWRNPATQRFAFGVQFEHVGPEVDRALRDVVESAR